MADQCLAASHLAIDRQLLRDFLPFLRPLWMAPVVLSFTWKVAGKITKLFWFWSLEWKKKTKQHFFFKSEKHSFKIPPLTASSVALPALCYVVPSGRHQKDQGSKISGVPPQGWASLPALIRQLLCGATYGTSRARRTSILCSIGPLQGSHQHLTGGRNFSSTERS